MMRITALEVLRARQQADAEAQAAADRQAKREAHEASRQDLLARYARRYH